MKVLIADKFEESGQQGLADLGADVTIDPNLKEDELAEAIKNLKPEVLIVRSTKVTGDMLRGSSLKVVIRAGAGYNTIDIATAREEGIDVCNCPGMNSLAVAELAFGLILCLDRRIPDNVQELREGKWNKKEFSKAKGIAGRTIGIIGMGAIGQAMIERAKAFGLNVCVYSSHLSQQEADRLGVEVYSDLNKLAAKSDIVSVHTSLRPETEKMLGTEFFDAMQDGAIFVNTSRAEVVDQQALASAIKSKGLRVGLDVFEGEPNVPEGAYEGDLKDMSLVYCTHHIGASTDQAQEAVAEETVRIVAEYQRTSKPVNVVN